MIINRTTFAPSKHSDMQTILSIHSRAFGRSQEATLTQQLIEGDDETLDLCARIDETIVGHGVLTELQGPEKSLALAPLSVDPGWRDYQIGTELVRRLLAIARQEGWRSVFVLGDPDYYGRFGFRSALADNVDTPYQGRSLQAIELRPNALSSYEGRLDYPSAFDSLAAA